VTARAAEDVARTARARRPYTPRRPAEERREQVLDAALALIVRDGYAAVSIDAIARELDVTRTVIYNVFDGLPELLHALLDRTAAKALSQVLTALATAGPSPAGRTSAATRAIVHRLVDAVADDPHTWTPIFMMGSDAPGAVRDRMERERETVRSQFRAMLEASPRLRPAGRRTPAEPRFRDLDMLSHALLGLGLYFGQLIVNSDSDLDRTRIADTVADLVIALLR